MPEVRGKETLDQAGGTRVMMGTPCMKTQACKFGGRSGHLHGERSPSGEAGWTRWEECRDMIALACSGQVDQVDHESWERLCLVERMFTNLKVWFKMVRKSLNWLNRHKGSRVRPTEEEGLDDIYGSGYQGHTSRF